MFEKKIEVIEFKLPIVFFKVYLLVERYSQSDKIYLLIIEKEAVVLLDSSISFLQL